MIVVSLSSDIGNALGRHFLNKGWLVSGTNRRETSACLELKEAGAVFRTCDLADIKSVNDACDYLCTARPPWDYLILCPGSLEPVGLFIDCDFDSWHKSYDVNFTNQMQIVHRLLKCRRKNVSPLVLFFAGGGVNNATQNYSAYTVAKISLIKMCELLDAEISDTRFSILGPGWVKTKIHEETLRAGSRAGANLQRTKDMLSQGPMTPMTEVIDCCEWLYDSPREVVSGRNFSVVYDDWRDGNISSRLKNDANMYKLRRFGN